MCITAVRGAIALNESGEEASQMVRALGELFDSLALTNNFTPDDIVSIQFTQTSDLKKMNAAAALRAARPEYGGTVLFCSQEPDVEGSLPRTIRVLVTWRGNGPATPVYSGAAAALRPDLRSRNGV